MIANSYAGWLAAKHIRHLFSAVLPAGRRFVQETGKAPASVGNKSDSLDLKAYAFGKTRHLHTSPGRSLEFKKLGVNHIHR